MNTYRCTLQRATAPLPPLPEYAPFVQLRAKTAVAAAKLARAVTGANVTDVVRLVIGVE